MPLTVGELAEAICLPGSTDTGPICERIRHWTREGLLIPIGDRNPGTGKHRRYDDELIADGAVLNALAEQGIQVVGRDLLHALSIARGAYSDWCKGKKSTSIFLSLDHIRTKAAYKRTHKIHDMTLKLPIDSELSIVVNLSHIFARLQRSKS